MKADQFIHLIGDKISYKKGENSLHIFFRSSSRGDAPVIQRLKKRFVSLLIAGILVLPPFFLPFHLNLKFGILIIVALWLIILALSSYQYFFKKYGLETLTIKNGHVSYRRQIITNNFTINLSHRRLKGPISVSQPTGMAVKNAIDMTNSVKNMVQLRRQNGQTIVQFDILPQYFSQLQQLLINTPTSPFKI